MDEADRIGGGSDSGADPTSGGRDMPMEQAVAAEEKLAFVELDVAKLTT